jgi:hypothetical protein
MEKGCCGPLQRMMHLYCRCCASVRLRATPSVPCLPSEAGVGKVVLLLFAT